MLSLIHLQNSSLAIEKYSNPIAMSSQTTHGATGPPITTKDTVLETGASATQDFKPIKAICAHLNAFHVYASDPSRSVEANHYCAHLSADVRDPFLSSPQIGEPKDNQGCDFMTRDANEDRFDNASFMIPLPIPQD